VEVRLGEELDPVGGVAVLAVGEIPRDDHAEARVVDPLDQGVEQRGEAGDDGGEQPSPGTQDAPGLAEGDEPVGSGRQVIERAEEEDDLAPSVRPAERARVAHLGAQSYSLSRSSS
jgi:hypothetical protein